MDCFIIFIIIIIIIYVILRISTNNENHSINNLDSYNEYCENPCYDSELKPVIEHKYEIKTEDITHISGHNDINSETWIDPRYDPEMKPENERKQYNGNVNYMVFSGKGIFNTTMRVRTIKPIKAFSYNQAYNTLVNEGFTPDSIQIERCCHEPPTEEQLYAMQEHKDFIPENICKEDASCLIDRYMHEDNFAGKELLSFATEQELYFSYYIGQKALLSYLWTVFKNEEKIALYMICIKKSISNKWCFNNFEEYKIKASEFLSNECFMNSFKRINEYNLIPNNISKRTNCYKIVLPFI